MSELWRGYEKVLGPKHTSILDKINNLGNLYQSQRQINGGGGNV